MCRCHYHQCLLPSILPFSSRSSFSEQPFVECISHNGCVFLKGSGAQMNSFAFHELRVNSFLTALPHARHLTQICLPCYVPYWRLLTKMLAHMVPNACATTLPAVRHFVFLPRGAEQHGTESLPSLAAIYLCSCTWLQTSFGARGRAWHQYCNVLMTGIKRHKLHYYLCTITSRAVIHYFYFWIILFPRDLMNKSTVFPKGEHFPSCWYLCVSKATNQPRVTVLRLMSWLETPVWFPTHTHREWFPGLQNDMNMLNLCFLFLCGWMHGLVWATHWVYWT